MAPVTATFPTAPRAGRLYLAPAVAAGFGAIGVGFGVWAALAPHHGPALTAGARGPAPGLGWFDPATWTFASQPIVVALLCPALTGLFGVLMAHRERAKTAQFQIVDNVLVLDAKRYPLAGATAVERDPMVLKGARKTWGNGGLGAIRGRFRSQRLGKFDAFLTDCVHAVVIRWPDKAVAVSPADPEFFVYSARKAAGLST